MTGGEACHQVLHILFLGDIDLSQGDPFWLRHHCCWEESEAGVPCEGKDLPASGVGWEKEGVTN